MKLSVSLPDPIAREIQRLAHKTEKTVSALLCRAWQKSRTVILRDEEKSKRSHQKAMRLLGALRGSLKEEFPDVDSVALADQAFRDVD